MMTRGDYIKTSRILAEYREYMSPNIFRKLVKDLGDMFAKDNARFVRARFEQACGL